MYPECFVFFWKLHNKLTITTSCNLSKIHANLEFTFRENMQWAAQEIDFHHPGQDWFIIHVKLGHSMDNGFIFKKINKD